MTIQGNEACDFMQYRGRLQAEYRYEVEGVSDLLRNLA